MRNSKTDFKKKQHSKQYPKFILAVVPAAVILAAGIAYVYVSADSPSQATCAQTVARLQALENADIAPIQKELQALKAREEKEIENKMREDIVADGALLSDVEIKQRYQGSVILGDSITESIVEYQFLGNDVVISKRGLRIADADEQIATAIGLAPTTVFMAFGSNDLELYEGDANRFIDAYRTQVQKLKDALPDTPIYINGILPLLPSAIEAIPSLGYYPEFNDALRQFCEEMGCTYIDNAFLVENHENMYEPDGEHVVRDYYPKWLTYMAETAGL